MSAARTVEGPGRRCQRRAGTHPCGGALAVDIDRRFGATILRCVLCERRLAGICRDCPLPVEGMIGRAMRCAAHKHAANMRSLAKYNEINHEKVLAKSREYYQNNPERHARRLEYKKAYRQLHRDKTAKAKRKWLLKEGKVREKYLRSHRKYNSKKARQLRKRAMALRAYYLANPERPVPKCAGCELYLDWTPSPGHGRPPKWCDSCAPAAELKRRQAKGRAIGALERPPENEWTPPLRLIEKSAGGVRTCWTEGCTTVLTGRAKKCPACKQREADAARALLLPRMGRGRRSA